MKNKSTIVLLLFLISIILVAVFADALAPYDPYSSNLKNAFQPPSLTHLFGTDKLGRDLFSRVIYGVRISLAVSIFLILMISIVGSALGIVAGYYGKWVGSVIMRFSDILMSCPSMVLAIALAGIMGAGLRNAMIAIFVVTVSKYIRLARSLVLKIINEDYINSAKMAGTTQLNIIIRYILPNIIQTLIITASTDIGAIILELSALSFLGFGVTAPTPELGLMINEGRPYMLAYPWLVFCPGIAIAIIVTIFNLLSDKMREWR
ncbi:ABC transporter permease [Candidatus Epulonipiscium viviparus]|uniref:ABC transporter permease n=1 Tax=Candidatus Epulonipiscium viviparus TaxID=420336 RepID=UPI00016C00A0|nr:ABC transporter permease [Candidatus Epulopiscium viviparus]